MASEDDPGASLRRQGRRQALLVGGVAGLVLVAFGAALIYFGATFEEPTERIATRGVPIIAPVTMVIGGVIAVLVGIRFLVRGALNR